MRLYLRKLKLRVAWIHCFDLLALRCTQNLDNFHQLIHTTLARKQRLAEKQLGAHAT